MPLFDTPFSLEIPARVGNLNAVFFINENLCVSNAECLSSPHNHHDYEIRYVATGACNQIIDNRVYEAFASDLLLVHPLEYHCQSNTLSVPESTQYNLRFTVEKPGEDSAVMMNAYHSALRLLNGIRRLYDDDCCLLPLFRLLTKEIYRKAPGFVANTRSICSCILVEILRLSGKCTNDIFPAEELKFHGYGRSKIDEFFRHKYLTDVKVQDLADDMKVSPRQVNRIMNRMFGMSFTQKLIEMRLQHIVLQLTHTNKSVHQICQECGFHNYNYFFNCFRRKFGMTPTEFREKRGTDSDKDTLSE